MDNKLYDQLLDFAAQDIEDCARKGSLFVADTLSGNIEITYDKNAQGFSFTKKPSNELIRKDLSTDQARNFLASLFRVVKDDK